MRLGLGGGPPWRAGGWLLLLVPMAVAVVLLLLHPFVWGLVIGGGLVFGLLSLRTSRRW